MDPGNDQDLRLRIMLTGPTGLDRIDGLTVTIRDDHFRRGEGTLTAGSPTREEIRAQVWGPNRFRPGTGPDEARADDDGRVTVYDAQLPIGEELPYLLERTRPPTWATSMTQESWNEEAQFRAVSRVIEGGGEACPLCQAVAMRSRCGQRARARRQRSRSSRPPR